MYTVLFAIRCDDGLSLEPGEHSLAGVDAERLAAWLANGWIVGATPTAPAAPEVEAPLTLTHYEGAGEAPPGTWEHYWNEQAAQAAAPAEASPRKRRKSEE